jgi:hypothetical protein
MTHRLHLALVTIILLLIALRPHIYTYSGLNAGVVLDIAGGYPAGLTIGYESQGTPGWFLCGQVDC